MVWGASFVVTRIALQSFTPVGLVATRLALATALLVAISAWTKRPLLPAPPDRLPCLLLGSVLGAHLFLQALGLRYTSAISAGWIIAFTPVPIALGGWIFLRQRLSGAGWGGIAVATAGIMMVIASVTPGFAQARTGDALQLVSCVTWTIYTLGAAPAVARNGALAVTTITTGAAAAILLTASAWSGILAADLTASAALSIIYLGVICGAVAYYLWYSAVRQHGVARAGSYLYLEPFVTVATSAALIGEPITLPVIAGGMVVLLGVWLVARGTRVPAGDT